MQDLELMEADDGCLVGIIISQQANFYFVQVDVTVYACSLRGRLKKEGETPLVGDRVAIALEPGLDDVRELAGLVASRRGAIVRVLPRARVLSRPAIANVDQLLVVMAADQPAFSPHMLDRVLIQASSVDLPCVIVINKRDLVEAAALDTWLTMYRDLGYRIEATQSTLDGVQPLRSHLAQRVSVLAGPSGVGKSSLANAIQPGLRLRAAEVSTKLQRGRHTTRHASLYRIEGLSDAWIADTPGFSFLEIEALSPAELCWHFPEMVPLIAACKYPSCLHVSEPACAVRAALDATSSRYDSYLRLLSELQQRKKLLAQRTTRLESQTKRRMVAHGEEAKMVKLSGAQRERNRRTHNQNLEVSWHEETDLERPMDDHV